MMEEKEYTRFRLNLPEFSVELAGEKKFVEELYRKVYRDLMPLLSSAKPTQAAIDPAPEEPKSHSRHDYTWIYSCTPHYNKVYVAENGVLSHSAVGYYLDARRVRRVYLDRKRSTFFSEFSEGNRTLWAEITPEGRRMIEEAAKENQKKP